MAADLEISEMQSMAMSEFDNPQTVALTWGGGAGGGKAVALFTKILTTSGWSTMGELQTGDVVFDKDGDPTEIIETSEILHRDCYKVTMSDGSEIIADGQHEWLTFTDRDRRALLRRSDRYREARRSTRKSKAKPTTSKSHLKMLAKMSQASSEVTTKPAPTGSIKTTLEIAETLKDRRGRLNHSIPLAGALSMPEKHLPMHPYVFGAWLGDGFTKHGKKHGYICAGHQDADEIFGYIAEHADMKELTPQPRYRKVRVEGLLPDHKYIPVDYLLSSEEQRLELLRGLMDTDGYSKKGAAGVEFTTVLPELAGNVAQLVRSLGWRCAVKRGDAKLKGRVTGPKFRITFTPDKKVFKIKRKADRQNPGTIRTKWKYVKSIEKVATVPTKCIMVDSPSSTYLAGEELTVTHNSFLIGLMAAIAAKKYPKSRWGLARKELKSLKQTTLATLIGKVHPVLGITENDYKLNLLDSTLEYTNGSQLLLLDLTEKPSDPEMEALGSLELTGAFIDEVGEVSKKPYDILASRVNRWLNKEYGITGKVVGSCNPGPGFIRQKFYDRYKELGGGRMQKWQNGYVWVGDQKLPAYEVYIRSTVFDNPFIDKNYIENLKRLPEQERRRLLDGDWDYSDEDDSLFPSKLIEKMTVYELPEKVFDDKGNEVDEEGNIKKFNKFIGVDPSDKGKDSTVVTLIDENIIVEQIEIDTPIDKEEAIGFYIAGKLISYATKNGFTKYLANNITIEGNGIGASLRDALRKLDWNVQVYTATLQSRNEGYYEFMVNADAGKIKILSSVIEDGTLVRQLGAHRFDLDTGKPQVTKKKDLRQALGRSPDHADSAMIANMGCNIMKPKDIRSYIRW